MMIFQNFQPKEKLPLNAFPLRTALRTRIREPSRETKLKVQDTLDRAEIQKLCNSLTSSTEPSWGSAHRGQELRTSSRQNKCAADVPGQRQLGCAHI